MSDPLTALRDAVMQQREIREEGDVTVLGARRFPSSCPTSYRSCRGQGELYTLDAILPLILSPDMKTSEYVKVCREKGIDRKIALSERKSLVAYLTGKQESLPYLDADAALEQRKLALDDDEQTMKADDGTGDAPKLWAGEKPLFTTIIAVSDPRKNFSYAIDTFDEAMKKRHREAADPYLASKRRREMRKKQNQVKGRPIIIVPSGAKALLSVYNAEDFLGGGIYRPTLENKKELDRQHIGRPDVVEIHRKSFLDETKEVTFEVRDSVMGFSNDQWRRIVAVFVDGVAWKLKGWKLGKCPAEIFQKVYCCHLHFDDEGPHPNAKMWGLRCFPVSKTKKHEASGIYFTIWKSIQAHIAARKADIVNY